MLSTFVRHRLFCAAPLSAFVVLVSGCTSFVVNSQARIIEKASPAVQAHWDYELAGDAIPYSLIQLEGLHHVSPDQEQIIVALARGYASYAFGWIEDEAETTDPLDFERVEHLNTRARWMYLRARNLAFRLIRLNHDGFDEAREGGLDSFKNWLATEVDDEDDAEMLFWAGYAWGAAINVSRDDIMMVADLGFARALVERSLALDETYFNAGATLMLAVINSSLSPAMGGNPAEGQRLFERALELTGRRAHLVHYNYARTYAVQSQDRELFDRLLREILDAPDQGGEFRLANKIAVRRARRLLAKADELFF